MGASLHGAPGGRSLPRETLVRTEKESRETIEAIRQQRPRMADDFPRIALFLFDAHDTRSLRDTLEAIPQGLDEFIEEIVVMWDKPSEGTPPAASVLPDERKLRLGFHRSPHPSAFGATRKEAVEHALARGFDRVIFMRADDRHPPEYLPDLILATLEDPNSTILATRSLSLRKLQGIDYPIERRFILYLAKAFQSTVLALRWLDDQSSFRLYPTEALRCIPYQLNADDRGFDTQILIQLRALNAPVRELRVGRSTWKEFDKADKVAGHAIHACLAALDYRAHQLHFSRRHRYMVDQGIHYTLKQSPTGSHMQIIESIASGGRVLDLGCSQGLLARPLAERGVRVTGVDAAPPARLADELYAYFQRDLELPIELPEGRIFDYVIVADVIEHLRNRQQLLRTARHFLKKDGRLIISTPNVAIWFYRLSLLVGRFEYGPRGVLDVTHVHLFTRATFRREIENAGFRILKQRVTALPFEVVFRSTGRSRLVCWIARAYHELARAWPSMFAYQFILEAEITTPDEDARSLP